MTPEIEGTVPIRSSIDRFFQAFQARVAEGLLTSRRARYAVSDAGAQHLEIRAMDWRTATSLGLNHVELRQPMPGRIHYRVRYWRWASYVVGLSGVVGVIGAALLLTLDVRDYLARHPASMIPGLSAEHSVIMAWLMVGFWGFVWPWILISLHKGPLRRLVTSIITDVDAKAG